MRPFVYKVTLRVSVTSTRSTDTGPYYIQRRAEVERVSKRDKQRCDMYEKEKKRRDQKQGH